MCDYSLHSVHNRLAVEGEALQIHRFPTHSLGLASVADLRPTLVSGNEGWWKTVKGWFSSIAPETVPAVCVPPGARLILREIPQLLQAKLNIGTEEEVTFVQLSPETPGYRDAIRFHNGQEILLQRLPVGQQLDVLCLSVSPEKESQVFQAVNRMASLPG
jgi:hypothetical protein